MAGPLYILFSRRSIQLGMEVVASLTLGLLHFHRNVMCVSPLSHYRPCVPYPQIKTRPTPSSFFFETNPHLAGRIGDFGVHIVRSPEM